MPNVPHAVLFHLHDRNALTIFTDDPRTVIKGSIVRKKNKATKKSGVTYSTTVTLTSEKFDGDYRIRAYGRGQRIQLYGYEKLLDALANGGSYNDYVGAFAKGRDNARNTLSFMNDDRFAEYWANVLDSVKSRAEYDEALRAEFSKIGLNIV